MARRLTVALVATAALLVPPVTAQERSTEEMLDDLGKAVAELAAEVEAARAALEHRTVPGMGAEARLAWYEQHVAMLEEPLYPDLSWQFLGPTNISGRVTDVAVVEPRGTSYTTYVATASSGVWKTVNEGNTWEAVFTDGASQSIGDVTLAPSNQDVVWVGTGEANIFRSSMAGSGAYKSTDAGATWHHMGLTGTHTIPRIVIHPTDPNLVYVAASGHEWTDNEERGVFRTRDGGDTWEKVLYRGPDTGVIDLVMDPNKPEILYAATWQRRRLFWNDPRSAPDHTRSGIWRSKDGGDTWEEIVEGLPAAHHRGRIGIDLARSNPSVVYAFVDNYDEAEAPEGSDSYGREQEGAIRGATVFRSDDRGDTWRQVSETSNYMERLSATYGWVFGQMRVDPTDEDTIYVMGLGLNVSNDGGKTFRRLRGMHGDHHALWIDPENPRYLVNGNDGGVVTSYDGGENWVQYLDNLPAVQFYNVGYDMAEPFRVYGSIQDHGSMSGVVDLSRGRDRIRATEWDRAPGGEASYHQIDPTDPNTVYAEGFYGRIFRRDLETGETARIAPRADEDAGEERYRGQWLAPFLISPHNPRIVYHGMNFLFRSMDRGESFEKISPDLTDDDPNEKGDIPYQTISSISESPFTFGHIYAGTDDGHLHVTRDSGATWTEITAGLSAHRWISRVVASAHDAETVYVAQNGKRNDDFTAYLWRSTDGGRYWVDISGGLPGGPINVVKEDPTNADILYVGTDLGVYVTVDGAESWHSLGHGIPTTFVHDLIVHPRDGVIVVATHGLGMWALDAHPVQGIAEPEEEHQAEPEAPAEPEPDAEEEEEEPEEEPEEEEAEEEEPEEETEAPKPVRKHGVD